jgi:uncharacterized membrane protein YdjX (TVP38/TMEM64 family)
MNRGIVKIGLLIILISAIAAFFVLDLQQYTTVYYIKQKHQMLLEYYENQTFLVLTLFGFIYIVVTGLSIPVATALTLLAGALFGFPVGLIMASFASTIGATLAFLIARFVARDYIQHKYSKQLYKINAGLEREGAFYLFALRLVPAFPFFIINAAMGLMLIKTRTFYWVSQLGMLPGTAVYVYAGTQLAQIESMSDIASPSLLIAFALLGLFPLIAKKLVEFMRKEKIHEQV